MIDDNKIYESLKLYTDAVDNLSTGVEEEKTETETETTKPNNNLLISVVILFSIIIIVCVILFLSKPFFIIKDKTIEGTYFVEKKICYKKLLIFTNIISLIIFAIIFAIMYFFK